MEYRVEELAQLAGVRVDTVRFYQTLGLLPSPERRGRFAVYSTVHLERLHRIRQLHDQGLTLQGVGRVLEREPAESASGDGASASLLAALNEVEGPRDYDRDELTRLSGFPPFLLAAAEQLGLLPAAQSGARYTESDLEALRAVKGILEAGFPLQDLLPLAREHAEHTERVADRAIELFERHVRRKDSTDAPGGEAVAETFRRLLPAVTALVAQHFQRTLIRRARSKLEDSGDREGLAAALDATERARLEVAWR